MGSVVNRSVTLQASVLYLQVSGAHVIWSNILDGRSSHKPHHLEGGLGGVKVSTQTYGE